MSGLHEAFDEIVADVPVYGDLDRAIEQADRERRRRYGVVAGLVAAAAVVAVIVGRRSRSPRRHRHGSRRSRPVRHRPRRRAKSQSPQTWADTAVAATARRIRLGCPGPVDGGSGCVVPGRGRAPRPDGRAPRALGELSASGSRVRAGRARVRSTPPPDDMGLIVDRSDLNLFDNGCRYLHASWAGTVQRNRCRAARSGSRGRAASAPGSPVTGACAVHGTPDEGTRRAGRPTRPAVTTSSRWRSSAATA